MRKNTNGKKKTGRLIAILASVAVVVIAVIVGLYHFGVIGTEAGVKRDLSASLARWVEEWKRGEERSLSDGLVFGKSDADHTGSDDDDALSAEALKTMMETQYGELIEAQPEAAETDGLFSILMRYTTVSYTLPSSVEAGQTVTFEITGPDMTKVISLLDETDTQEALFAKLEAILSSGHYETRTVSVPVEIEALDDGYRLRSTYALIDGLYGGLLGVVSDVLPEVE